MYADYLNNKEAKEMHKKNYENYVIDCRVFLKDNIVQHWTYF